MENVTGDVLKKWLVELFPLNRSLTGTGVRQTLDFLRKHLGEEFITHNIPSGTKAFDWIVPQEWQVNEAWISDLEGNILINFANNNLHLVGYSIKIDQIISKDELDNHLHSIPELPDAIPYVTSYYKEEWGFCLTHNDRMKLGNGPFKVFIDSKHFDGFLNYGEFFVKGTSKDEVLLTTYICHPSMASNELSGPVISLALAKWLSQRQTKYSYRFLFSIETIGTIHYVSQNLEKLKNLTKAGFVLTCLGDDRNYSYVPSRNGDTLSDRIAIKYLKDNIENYTEYTWLDRGSDERQLCSPGVDLPICSLMRSKYGEYPEYHTSLDNLDFVSEKSLFESFQMLKTVIEMIEENENYLINTKCEPQLGVRGLYPNKSTRESGLSVRNLMNVISYLDGTRDLITISELCKISFSETLHIVNILRKHSLISVK